MNQMLTQVKKIQGKMHEMIQAIKNGDSPGVAGNDHGESAPSMEVGEGSNKRRVYYWGWRFHSVPQGFQVPKMTLANLITCWYCGNERDGIPPLRFVQGHDLVQKNGKVLVCQWKKMITYVNIAARKIGFLMPSDPNKMRVCDTVDLYSAIKPCFKYKSIRCNHKRRHEGILWKTIFNIICKNNGKFANEID